MLGADGDGRVETERMELGALMLAAWVVGLVDDQDHRLLRTTQPVRNLVVQGRQASLRVDHEQDHISLGHGHPRLVLHAGFDMRSRLELEATGVNKSELAPVPVPGCVDPIASRARDVLHDRDPLTGKAVEEGRLTDVGTANDGDDREGGHGRECTHPRRVLRSGGCGSAWSAPGSPALTESPSRSPSGSWC